MSVVSTPISDVLDPKCGNCGHTKSQHYHIPYRKLGEACHARIWKRGVEKECGCQKFIAFINWDEWARRIRKGK
jgi:hypothetical protein